MSALWIAHVSVNDAESYAKYAELAGPAIAKHGGHFIARAGLSLIHISEPTRRS